MVTNGVAFSFMRLLFSALGRPMGTYIPKTQTRNNSSEYQVKLEKCMINVESVEATTIPARIVRAPLMENPRLMTAKYATAKMIVPVVTVSPIAAKR